MSKNSKIALIIIAIVIVLCICACVAGAIILRTTGKVMEENLVLDDPQKAQSVAQSILDYDLPAGYQEEGAMDMGFMKMVMIVDQSSSYGPLIMIAEMPSGMGIDETVMRQQIEQSMQRSMGYSNFNVKLVDEQVHTIRGDEVTFFEYAGTDGSGNQVKQLVSEFFGGENGTVMLMIIGDDSNWDQAEIDAFLDSIH
jgi:hypothetical protein